MKKIIFSITTICIALNINAQVSLSINVNTAGTLSSLLSTVEKSNVTDLIITGDIDSRDFVTLRDVMTKLAVLDISKVTIHEYSGTSGTTGSNINNMNTIYPANEIPEHSFCNPNTIISKKTLKTVNLPNSITSISNDAFLGCNGLTSLTIPIAVTSIKSGAFCLCSGLKSLIIPNSVNSIGDAAFDYCTGLTSVYACSIIPINMGSSNGYFNYAGYDSTCFLFVPFGSKNSYQLANQWKNFKNIIEVYQPSIATSAISAKTTNSVITGGYITNAGSSFITARGICWSKSFNPTTSDNITTDGTGNGVFTSCITELTPGNRYHIRAYASSNMGMFYGADSTFRTLNLPNPPSIETFSVTDISINSASTGGQLHDNYTYPTTSFGVCLSKTPNPLPISTNMKDISTKVYNNDSDFSDAFKDISFNCYITGLYPGTTYYLRSFATNEFGMSFGEERTFTTLSISGLSENNIDENDFYPNPTNGIINIKIASTNLNNYVVNVNNSLGQKIYTSNLNSEKTTIDLSKLSKSGFLFMQIMNKDGLILKDKKILFK